MSLVTSLYAIRFGDTPHHKVGYSADPERRLRRIQALAPSPLELVGTLPECGSHTEALVAHYSKSVGFDLSMWETVVFCASRPVTWPDGHEYNWIGSAA